MEEGFKSVDEILQEVADDEGMSLRELKDLWRHQKVYMQKQMDTKDVYAVFIPYIGTLSLNLKQFKKELKGKTRSAYKDFIVKIENLLKHDGFRTYKNTHKRITGVNRLARRIVKDYHTGVEVSNRLMSHSKCWDIIEKCSNGVYEKRDKKLIRFNDE